MRKTIILLLYLGFLGFQAQAQSEKFKALFMYNFTKYVQFPATPNPEGFVIGILGNSTISEDLKVIASKQKVGSQNMVVKVFNSIEEIEKCNMIFISANKSSLMSDVITKLNGLATLIVSDKEGLTNQGSCINFVLDGNKLKYEISKTNIEKKGLSASSNLYSLGIQVN